MKKIIITIVLIIMALIVPFTTICAEGIDEPITKEEFGEKVYAYENKIFRLVNETEIISEYIESDETIILYGSYTLEDNILSVTIGDEITKYMINEDNTMGLYVEDKEGSTELNKWFKEEIMPYILTFATSYGSTMIALFLYLKKFMEAKGTLKITNELTQEITQKIEEQVVLLKNKIEEITVIMPTILEKVDKVISENELLNQLLKDDILAIKESVKEIAIGDEKLVKSGVAKTVYKKMGDE